ncbi:MAG: nucleotide sugar dehydrogenase [Chloroflexota bacterium]
MSHKADILSKIDARTAHVAVVGLGYVGLPLATEFAEVGFTVTAIDIDDTKIARLKDGISYIDDIASERLVPLLADNRLRPTSDYTSIGEVDAVCICVPTPVSDTKDPDMRYINQAVASIAEHATAGMLVVLESTTYPGTTEELVQPQFEALGLTVGESVFIAFSGERIDPGNAVYQVKNTPKVVGGVTPHCTEIATELYAHTIDTVVPVSSPTAAEVVKLLENTFRSVNIGLANEMAVMCDKLGVDVWEVIDAAATKPFGFMPFYPGPGVGGHCIPIDPHYLNWKLKTLNYNSRFIELASEINASMPHHVVHKVTDALNNVAKAVRGSQIVVLGVAYKPNIDDMRESPALEVIDLLIQKGADVVFHDPHIEQLRMGDAVMTSCDYSDELLQSADCVVITTNHAWYDWAHVQSHSAVIVDTRNAIPKTGAGGIVVSI